MRMRPGSPLSVHSIAAIDGVLSGVPRPAIRLPQRSPPQYASPAVTITDGAVRCDYHARRRAHTSDSGAGQRGQARIGLTRALPSPARLLRRQSTGLTSTSRIVPRRQANVARESHAEGASRAVPYFRSNISQAVSALL